MALVELATGARVVRTREDLHLLTLEQPGPEVIRSGTVGERGLARWEAPRRTPEGMVFYANSSAGHQLCCRLEGYGTR